MSRAMWKDLPPEVLENVLARLPVHVLCRFRLVCKTWNRLISQPGFANLRAQLAPRQAFSVLISPKRIDFHQVTRKIEWEVLDTVEKRSYTLLDTFILGQYRGLSWSKYTLAADGGLIYTICYGGSRKVHLVCNPVSKSFHEIVEPQLQCTYDRDIVVMSVDNATNTYRIITMESYDSFRIGREKVYLYDSTTSVWRKLCEVPGDEYCAYSSIFMDGLFYTLFMDLYAVPWCLLLYSCDLATGVWSYIDVAALPQPSHPQDKSQLVVSSGRLFLVEYTGLPMIPNADLMSGWELLLAMQSVKRKHLIKVTIWEILLGQKRVKQVTEMAKYSKYSRTMLQRPAEVMGEAVVAVGCANSIVISSLLGRRVAYDLSKKCWQELPAYSCERKYDRKDGPYHRGICAGLVDF